MQIGVPIPWWGVGAAVLAAAALAWWAYARPPVSLTRRQRGVLTALRFGVLLAVLIVLLRPVVTEPATAGRGVVAILVDASRSMAIADARGRRIDRAAAIVRDRLVPGLRGAFDVAVLGFGEGLVAAGPAAPAAASRPDRPNASEEAASRSDVAGALDAAASRSDLAGALDAVAERFGGQRLAGVVVLTDGAVTGSGDAARAAARMPVAVQTIGIGRERPGPDREVAGLVADDPPASGSVIDVSATVLARGLGDAPTEVRLLEDGRLLEVRRVALAAAGTPVVETFHVSPDPERPTLYTVEMPVDPGELVAGNNRRSVLVRPFGRPRRLLMIEGAPGYEHSFLKRAWLADPGFAVDAVVRKGQNDRGEQTLYVQGEAGRSGALAGGYPEAPGALFAYDAVVLANIEAEFFSDAQLDMTAEFVAERGGGLLLLGPTTLRRRGYLGSTLEPVLPAVLADRLGLSDGRGAGTDGTRMMPTDAGLLHPMLRLGPTPEATRERWRAMPALSGSVRIGPVRPGAEVLAVSPPGPGGGAERPLVVVQRYGAGRAMIFAGRASWRWRMQRATDDRAYETWWGQVARWLVGRARERMTVMARGSGAPGDPVQIEVEVLDGDFRPAPGAAVRVGVTDPTGARDELDAVPVPEAPGRHAASTRPALAGVHRIDAAATREGVLLASRREWVLVGAADAELADPWLNDDLLRRVAAAAGGAHFDPANLDDLPERLRAAAGGGPVRVTFEAWHRPWVFLLIFVLLAGEWSLRRAWGMR